MGKQLLVFLVIFSATVQAQTKMTYTLSEFIDKKVFAIGRCCHRPKVYQVGWSQDQPRAK